MTLSHRQPVGLDAVGLVAAHELGQINIAGTLYQLIDRGAWSSIANYSLGNFVSDGGVDYLCVGTNVAGPPATNLNDEPPGGNWQDMRSVPVPGTPETNLFLSSRRIWTPASAVAGDSTVWAVYADTLAVPASTTQLAFNFGGNLIAGTELFGYGGGNDSPVPLTDGTYAFTVDYELFSTDVPGKYAGIFLSALGVSPALNLSATFEMISDGTAGVPALPLTAVWPLTTARTVQVIATQNHTVFRSFGVVVTVIKIAGGMGGGGIQFSGAAAYGDDNVGGGLQVEATGFVGGEFSEPAGVTFGDSATNYSEAFNAANGSLFTASPSLNPVVSPGIAAVTVEHGAAAGSSAYGLQVTADTTALSTGGGYAAKAAIFEADADDGLAVSLASGASSQTGHAVGVIATGAGNAAGSSSAGVQASASVNGGSGDVVGVTSRVAITGGGTGRKIAYEGKNQAGAVIFEVRDDGSIHGLTGAGPVVFDL